MIKKIFRAYISTNMFSVAYIFEKRVLKIKGNILNYFLLFMLKNNFSFPTFHDYS